MKGKIMKVREEDEMRAGYRREDLGTLARGKYAQQYDKANLATAGAADPVSEFAVSQAISSNPEVLAGTPVFTGTRVPVRILFEFLQAGDSLAHFLEEFPSVSKQLAQAALAQALTAASRDARAA